MGRKEDDSPGSKYPLDLAQHSLGIVNVLQHLGAKDHIEAAVVAGQILGYTDPVHVRSIDRVDPEVDLGLIRKQRQVGLVAATDVEDPQVPTASQGGLNLSAQLSRQQPQDEVVSIRSWRISPLFLRPRRDFGWARHLERVRVC